MITIRYSVEQEMPNEEIQDVEKEGELIEYQVEVENISKEADDYLSRIKATLDLLNLNPHELEEAYAHAKKVIDKAKQIIKQQRLDEYLVGTEPTTTISSEIDPTVGDAEEQGPIEIDDDCNENRKDVPTVGFVYDSDDESDNGDNYDNDDFDYQSIFRMK